MVKLFAFSISLLLVSCGTSQSDSNIKTNDSEIDQNLAQLESAVQEFFTDTYIDADCDVIVNSNNQVLLTIINTNEVFNQPTILCYMSYLIYKNADRIQEYESFRVRYVQPDPNDISGYSKTKDTASYDNISDSLVAFKREFDNNPRLVQNINYALKNLNDQFFYTLDGVINGLPKIGNKTFEGRFMELLVGYSKYCEVEGFSESAINLTMLFIEHNYKKLEPDSIMAKHLGVLVRSCNSWDIYPTADQMPEFNNGMGELEDYVRENLKYPKEAIDKKIEGKVRVGFVIDELGAIRDVKIVEGVHRILDIEAVKLVKSMPDWKPGIQDGKAVKVSYVLPVTYNLGD